jgi:Na+-driven multidrug efflux pump
MFKKENIKKDFWKIFFPLLLIFYIFIAYNLVDIFFASLISEKAIA